MDLTVVRPPGGLRSRFGIMVAVAVLLLMAAWVLVPNLFVSRPPETIDPIHALLAPGLDHPFGTDQLGRDMFSRVVYGSRLSLVVGAGATLAALLIGALIGLVAGYFGGWMDSALMRVVDVQLTFPALLLALGVLAVVGRSAGDVAFAVGISNFGAFARLTRSEVLRVRSRPYVDAATVSGVGRTVILVRHIMPNAAAPVVSLGMLGFGVAMLASSSLSFLGFGPRPPAADWGTLAAGGRDYIGSAWWMTTFPSAAVVVTVLAVTRLGAVFQRRVSVQ